MDSREVQQKVDALKASLHEELRRRGHEVSQSDVSYVMDVDGEGVVIQFVPIAERRRRRWDTGRTTYSGKVRFDVGEFPRTKRIHEPKGGHTAAALADEVLAMRELQVKVRAASAERLAWVRECERRAKQLNEGLASKPFGEQYAKLYFSTSLTPEQAEKFAALARELGL